MKVLEIINELRKIKVIPRLNGTQLKLTGDTKNISEEFLNVIKSKKEELTAFLKESLDQAAFASIKNVPVRDSYPVSNAQRRLWILSQFEGGNTAYNIVTGFYLKGVVIKAHLNKAFQDFIHKHESLRTVFVEIDGMPRQVIKDNIAFNIDFENIGYNDAKVEFLKSKLDMEATGKFDLSEGPLIRVTLYQISEDEYAMLFAVHHIISDGWSIGIMVSEVMRSYEAYCRNEISGSERLQVQYKDYVNWLNEKITNDNGRLLQEFWSNEFSGNIATLNLPSDFERPEIKSFEGSFTRFFPDPQFYNNILKFCQEGHVTPFNFFRAVLSILLSKFTGQKEITIGTPVSGRNHFDLENQFGLYVNTLPLKMPVETDMPFNEFLQKVSENSFRAFQYQEYPYDKILESIDIERDSSRNPLFDVMLVLQNTALGDGSLNLSKQYNFELVLLNKFLYGKSTIDEKRPAKFDLTFYLDKDPENQFYIEIEYSTALFKRERIVKYYETFINIISQVLDHPKLLLSEIEIIDEREKHKILHKFNSAIGSITENSILDLFIDSFHNHTQKNALVHNSSALSYGELDLKSDHLAKYFSSLTNTAGNPRIALLMERSEWTLITILGILKSGAAYIPVDVNYPLERITYIINDSQPEILVADQKGAGLVPEHFAGKLIHTNFFQEMNLDVEPGTFDTGDLKESTAYIIYTSGSTGNPKGVNISHRNVIAFLKWAGKEFAHTPFELLYATTSYCFDLSIFELFFPLTVHKTIRLLDSALQIPDHIPADKKVMINTVPSVVRSLIEIGINWENVVALNMAGEVIPEKIKNYLDFSKMEVRNLYGPTEDTTYSTVYRFSENILSGSLIGKPVGYTHLYIMDNDQNLFPEGIEGEICLSGQSVARGYYHLPELTAEKFLDNRLVPGMLLYRTGDIGRWQSDGNVEFLGRKDDQVKLRGHRIELNEIQTRLEKHPAIAAAAVIIGKYNGDDQIIAYWAGEDGLTEEDVKSYLSKLLPGYMVPAHSIRMDNLPITSNGKLDKKNLPAPQTTIITEDDNTVPDNEIESDLLEIWKDVLHLKNINVKDNFFQLGGHSLKALNLKARIEKKWNKELTLNEIFLYPNLKEQAAIIEKKFGKAAFFIPKTIDQPNYPISYTQERLWVLTSFEEASKAYHMYAAFRVNGVMNVRLFKEAYKLVIEKHEILRTVFGDNDGVPFQLVLPQDERFYIREVILPAELTVQQETEILEEKTLENFDLKSGPLINCYLFLTGEQKILLFTMHHMISDGWSIGIFYRDLMRTYLDLLNGNNLSLPVPGIQFKDYVMWQRNEYEHTGLQKHKDFWMNMFKDDIPVLELPADYYRKQIKTYQGATYTHTIKKEEFVKIQKLAMDSGVSLFMVLMAALNVLMKKYTNQSDIVIGTPVAGREQHQLFDQIGLYVNTLPVRTKIDGEDTFQALLDQQKQLLLKVFEFQSFPFEKLIEELNVKRNPSRSPLFDVMLVLQNTGDWNDDSTGAIAADLKLERIALPSRIAKYDLTFSFLEAEDNLVLDLEFNTDLFKEETVKKMTSRLVRLFVQVVEQPDIKIKNISLIEDHELDIILSKADQTHITFDHYSTITSLFEQAANSHPDAVAIEIGNRLITYRELDLKSGQLSKILINDHGVKPEQMVVLHFERTEWMLIAIFGVLKAGAAYVPIDPAYPESRINYIFEDTNSHLVLYDAEPEKSVLTRWADRTFLDISRLDFSGGTASVNVDPHSLAYVIYTSGTTGDPKGVLIEHINVTRLLFNTNNYFDFNSSDRWVLFHSYCFDVSVWEMYGALLNGGCLVIISKETAQDSTRFYDLLLDKNVTVLNQTPTAFRSLVQNNGGRIVNSPPASVRYLIFAGEALMPEILKTWAPALPFCKIINMYGITETTVHVTYKEITQNEINENQSNIGLPLPTLSCHVLDTDLQPVPVDIIGELCVGGAGVARGYLNKPDLTALRFIRNPYRNGETLYRSGDFARILPSGDIEYIGRKDDQVKIRGYRIELAEVQSAVNSQKGIKDTIVLTFKNNSGDHDLVAYFIPEDFVDVKSLRKDLHKVLPAYMVPSFLISLTSFPLNRNGKLDRAELPLPKESLERHNNFISCRNDTDRKIADIWEKVLERDNIGIKDNFFDLGGHSLKATRVISKIHEQMGIKVDLKSLFIDPTIEHLSNYIDTMLWIDNQNEVNVKDEDEIVF